MDNETRNLEIVIHIKFISIIKSSVDASFF